MADHWKTLANRLGTPGIDEPEVDENEVDKNEVDQYKDKSLASGTQSSSSIPTYSEFPSDNDPASKASKEVKPTEDALSSVEQAPHVPESQPAPAKPAKRKSSWEALASLFNVSIDRSEPEPETASKPEPQPEPRQSESRRTEFKPESARSESASRHSKTPVETSSVDTGSRKELSIFDEPDSDPNTALDVMFGDVPREKLRSEGAGWGKPKRVVDDLGWDEVDDQPIRDEDDSEDDEPRAFSAENVESLESGDEVSGDEPLRKVRRRRRRGRRGRGRDDESNTAEDSLPDEAAEDDSPELPVSWKHDVIEVESAGPWAEPESFESDVFDSADDSSDEPFDDDNDADDGIEVVRRSNRRRRRRGRGREEAPVAEGKAVPRDVTPRDTRESGARDSESRRDVRSERSDAPRDARRGESASNRESTPRNEPVRAPRENTARGQREPAGRDSGGRDSSGRDSGGRDSSGRDSRGRDRTSRSPRAADLNAERPRRDAVRPVDQTLPVDDFDLDFVEPIDDLDEIIEEDRPAVAERAPGGRRRRGGRKPVDSPARSRSTEDDEIEDVVDEGEEDDIASDANKHRNIPTWSDSLESIILANTENHKRNEGRGGQRGGSRPRGRR